MRNNISLWIIFVLSVCMAYLALGAYTTSQVKAATIMPIKIHSDSQSALLWGGWNTVDGYVAPGTNSVEIRCSRARMTCSEAMAVLLQHDDGMDLDASAFSYQIIAWNDQHLEAVSDGGLGLCIERRLSIDLVAQSAQLQWKPAPGCEADAGKAVLVGGPS